MTGPYKSVSAAAALEQLGVLVRTARDEGIHVHVEPAHAFPEEIRHALFPVGHHVKPHRFATFEDARDCVVHERDDLRMFGLAGTAGSRRDVIGADVDYVDARYL